MSKITFFVLFILSFIVFVKPSFSKILIVVESGYNNANSDKVARYAHELLTFENTKSSIVTFTKPDAGTLRESCSLLWYLIRNEYERNNGLEGVVLVGELPEPLFYDGMENGKIFTAPKDYYYMDIVDQDDGNLYDSDEDIWNFDSVKNCFTGYKNLSKKHIKDIWVSHIFAHKLYNIRKGLTVLGEYDIINDYFDRLHNRMIGPANVPNRGFAMSGITNWFPYNIDNILNFSNLNLENYFEFTHPFNTPYNWISQLQAGPKGNLNNGAFNEVRYPNERNVKNCMANTRIDAFTGRTVVADTNGYEWAGLYEHSGAGNHDFNHFSSDIGLPAANGRFSNVTLGHMLGSNDQLMSGGYNGGYYLYNNGIDVRGDSIPTAHWYTDLLGWNHPAIWRGTSADFKMVVADSGEYKIEIYYEPLPTAEEPLKIKIFSLDSGTILKTKPLHIKDTLINQRVHMNTAEMNWEIIGTYSFNLNCIALVYFDINGCKGDFIIDAVRFTRVADGTQFVVDNNDSGFTSSSWVNRSFYNMQDESPNHDAYSKVNFFLFNACHVAEYSAINNLGVMYGMTHNGLICIGPSTVGFKDEHYEPLTKALGQGCSFGDAFLQQYRNSTGLSSVRTIIGAGTLKAEPFEKFGTQMAYSSNFTVSDTQTVTHNERVLVLDHLEVTSSGNYTANAKKIRIFPETRLQGYTRIVAN